MCSTSEKSSSINILNNQLDKLDLKDDEINGESEVENLLLRLDQIELLEFDEMLIKRFGATRSQIEEHRKEIIAACLKLSLQHSSRVADTINVKARKVHFGPVVNIVENIVLNGETNELNIENRKTRDYKNYFPTIDRMHWLAQCSVSEIDYLKKPAYYVIICHTASQEAYTQSENILMVRLCQTYHIESKGWADIAYNFCIGCDSNVYEGRGWFAQGAHSLSYNAYSVGIAFIGCFLTTLPPPAALRRCKDLIAHGVKIGAISPDYELIGHRQCRPFLSPGDCLFNEISTWDHFNPHVTNTDPCKFKEL